MNRMKEETEKAAMKSAQILRLEKRFAVSTVVLTVIALMIAIFGTLLAYQSRAGYDMTSGGIFTLSEGTRDVIGALDKDVRIGAVYASGKEDAMVKNILERFDAASDRISVEFVDAQASPALLSSYNIGDAKTVANGTIIINSGGRYRLLNDDDMFTYGNNGNIFYGEQDITGAVRYVTTDDLPVVYVVTGHGESTLQELSEAVGLLENEAYDVRQLVMLQYDIPDDADVLLIPAPEKDISEYELDLLNEYMRNGGRLLLMADPFLNADTADLDNLNRLTLEYGIDLTNNYVTETDSSYYLGRSEMYLIPRYGDHVIVNGLAKDEKLVVMPVARGLRPADYDENSVKRTALLASSPNSIAHYTVRNQDGTASRVETDGPVVLAWAASRDSGRTGVDQSRIVVTGDGSFILGGNVTAQGNADLLVAAVSWLRGAGVSVSVPGKVINSGTMLVRGSDFVWLAVVCCAVIPAVMFIAAAVIRIRRRNR